MIRSFFPSMFLWAVVGSSVLVGCKGADSGQVTDDLDQTTKQAPPPTETVNADLARSGLIDRKDLDAVLAQGPSNFLKSVDVKARVVDDQFAGWQIVRSPFSGLDLKPGDVVLSVNGQTLERPLQLQALWQELQTSAVIFARVEREGKEFELRFTIQGDGLTPSGGTEAPPAESEVPLEDPGKPDTAKAKDAKPQKNKK